MVYKILANGFKELKCNVTQTIRQNLASLVSLDSARIQESKKVTPMKIIKKHKVVSM